MYVNVETVQYAGGEIRGQLVNATCTSDATIIPIIARIEAKSVIPPFQPDRLGALGVAVGQYNYATRLLTLDVYLGGPIIPFSVEVKGPATEGENGNLVLSLPVPGLQPWRSSQILPESTAQSLINGRLYVEMSNLVSSPPTVFSYIRGQLYATCPRAVSAAITAAPALSLLMALLAVAVAVLGFTA
jgi:hypothetical protein